MIDIEEALPELDDLQGHKQRDGHQVGVQNPEGDHEDYPVHKAVSVVTLHVHNTCGQAVMLRNPTNNRSSSCDCRQALSQGSHTEI